MIETILASLGGIVGAAALGALLYRGLRQRSIAKTLIIDSPRAIVEDRFVRLGGIDQWIGIRGEDRRNPVLLVLHGGPGSPYSIFTPLVRSWEKHFTIVQWDQRGAGKTLGRNGKRGCGEISFDRIAADGIELADVLRASLGHDKIILLSSSMGTLVGLPMVKRRPDLFSAYVGTDFNVGVVHNERVSYPLTLSALRAAGDRKAVAALERIGGDPLGWDVRAWSFKQRCTARTVTVGPGVNQLLLPLIFLSPSHSLRDVSHLLAGLDFSAERLFAEFMAFDAWQLGTRLEVPFFLFHGEADVFTSTALATEYFRAVDAPIKTLALIGNAGHFAAFAEPAQFLAALLTHVRPLATASDSGPSLRPESVTSALA